MKKSVIKFSLMLWVAALVCPGYAQNNQAQTTPLENPKQIIMGKCIQADKANTIQISDAIACNAKHAEKGKSQVG